MLFIVGRVLEHSVESWGNEECFVIIYFMKDKVHNRVRVVRLAFLYRFFLKMVGEMKVSRRSLRKSKQR
jgi:hypothetical protein